MFLLSRTLSFLSLVIVQLQHPSSLHNTIQFMLVLTSLGSVQCIAESNDMPINTKRCSVSSFDNIFVSYSSS